MDYETLFEKGIVDRNEVRVKMGLPEETAPTNNEALINAINGLSPLVANKVLNELSINEIRGLVGLSPVIGGEGKSQISEFSDKNPFADEDEQLKVYAGFGEEENYFEFADLTEKELKVIEVVNENPKASLKEISEVTKIAEEDIDKILQVLDQKGKIKYTSKAVKILDADILKQTLVVRYKYDLRADAPKLVAGGESRDFCKKLISLGRVYSREDIDKMSTVLGYDVWKRRGGWYHNPNTDVNEPACRHEWKQIIVRRKNA
jgi:DNA-binding MarR family transcriptional regulator